MNLLPQAIGQYSVTRLITAFLNLIQHESDALHDSRDKIGILQFRNGCTLAECTGLRLPSLNQRGCKRNAHIDISFNFGKLCKENSTQVILIILVSRIFRTNIHSYILHSWCFLLFPSSNLYKTAMHQLC